MSTNENIPTDELTTLVEKIHQWGKALGFQKIGITDINLDNHETYLTHWLNAGYHGDMTWMERNQNMRIHPDELVPGTLRVISARMDYLPPNAKFAQTLNDPTLGYISRYALGRDYHKLIRQRLKKLGEYIANEVSDLGFRPFVDSAPVLERPLAEKAGLGWVGKHSLLLDKDTGSWFFIGELLVNIPLPTDSPVTNQCGKCVACKTTCPTNAIVDDKIIDARRCISYLTIEYDGIIPTEFRRAMGNRIYGCDDCQLVCPFNRSAQITKEKDFHPRSTLFQQSLLTLFNWSETTFLKNTEGSPIRRIGFNKWQRNLIIALGNAPYSIEIINSLNDAKGQSEWLDEHIIWAIDEQFVKQNQQTHANILQTSTERLIRIIQKGLPRDA